MLYCLAVCFGILPLIYTCTSWLRFANYPLSRRLKRVLGGVGIASMGATLWLSWRSHRDLSTNWSPTLEIGAQHTLVTIPLANWRESNGYVVSDTARM